MRGTKKYTAFRQNKPALHNLSFYKKFILSLNKLSESPSQIDWVLSFKDRGLPV